MHKVDFPICLNGFKAKTINVRSQAGGTKFLLQQVNELGLPFDAKIVAIWARVSDSAITASNNLKLVSTAVFNNAYINLKDESPVNKRIDLLASEYHLPKLTAKALFMEPVLSTNIDWNQSFLQINSRATAVDGAVFEIVVIYSDNCDIEPFPNRFIFRDGVELAGVRYASFEVELNSAQKKYSLSNSDNIGIPQDAIILGFDTRQNAFPLYGTDSIDAVSFAASYLTLKQGTDSFISEFPSSLTAYEQLISSLDYFPIIPTKNLAIDWQQSGLEITDNTNVTNTMVFQITIIWWNPNC